MKDHVYAFLNLEYDIRIIIRSDYNVPIGEVFKNSKELGPKESAFRIALYFCTNIKLYANMEYLMKHLSRKSQG